MKTYNTYQEAKIANQQSNICVSTDGEFAAEECVLKLRMAEVNKWRLCNPKDYCMTLEEFLARGIGLFVVMCLLIITESCIKLCYGD